MAVKHFYDAYVKLNSVDLSDHVMSVTWKERVAGLKDWSVEVTFKQDYAAASVDATVWALLGSTSAIPIDIRPASTDASATNPRYYGNVVLESYPPLDGAVGTLQEPSVTLQGNGALTRATST